MGLESIVKFAGNVIKSSLLAGALALNFGCSDARFVPNNPPVIKQISDETIREGRSIELYLDDVISDKDGDPLKVTLVNSRGTIVNNIFQYTDPADDNYTDEVYTINFLVNDGKEKTAGSFNLVQLDNKPPLISNIPDQIAKEGKQFILNLEDYISDGDGDPVIATLVNSHGRIINSNIYEFANVRDYNYTDDSYIINFIVSDGVNSSVGSFNLLHVDNRLPVVGTIPTQIVREGEAFALNLNNYVSDEDGDSLRITSANNVGTIVDNWFYYTFQDSDFVDNEKTKMFYLSDGLNVNVLGSFTILEQDAGITTTTETLSSGLEAIILDNAFPDETSIAVNSHDHVHIGYKNGSTPTNNRICMTLLGHIDNRWLKNHIGVYNTGRWNSIVIDNQDRIHSSYSTSDRNGEDIIYCSLANISVTGNQNNIYVDRGSSVGLFNNIYLDSNGKPHITYQNWCNGTIKYATNASGTWVETNNINGLGINYRDSLVIDSNDKLHVAYTTYDLGSYGLKYANDLNGNWQKQLIDTDTCTGNGNSIAQDNNNVLHIAYSAYNSSANRLRYVSNSGGSWSPVTIEEQTNYAYRNPVIALNGNNIGILYTERRSTSDVIDFGLLKFATNATGSWRVHTLDNRTTCSAHSLTVDSTGKFHASYVENNQLKKISFTESELGQ